MSDFTRMLTATATTVFAGVLVFLLGQIIQRFIFDPIQEQARVVGNIAHALLAFGHLDPLAHKPERLEEASKTLRELAAQLRAGLRLIPYYGFFEKCHFVVKRENVLETIRALIGWSGGVFNGNTLAYRQRVASRLKIPADEFEQADEGEYAAGGFMPIIPAGLTEADEARDDGDVDEEGGPADVTGGTGPAPRVSAAKESTESSKGKGVGTSLCALLCNSLPDAAAQDRNAA